MNYYEHHIGDYAAATAHLSLIEDAVYSRMLRRYYMQEGPLPPDWRQVARLVGARTEEEQEAVRAVLCEFFTMADEGYRQKRADEVIATFHDKQEGKAEERENEAERKRRYRERRADLFEQLRAIGIVPAFDTPMDELVRLLSRGTDAGQDGDGTATQAPITSNQSPVKARAGASASGSRLPADWTLPADWREWAKAERPELDPAAEAAKFADYWHALPGAKGRKTDWLKTWRNWIRSAYGPRAGPAVTAGKPSAAADFRGKTYESTPIDQLHPDLRAAAERALRDD